VAVDIRRQLMGGFTVLDLSGRFVVSAGESEILPFRSVIRALIEEGRVLIAVNLAALTSIDARGLGELVFTRAVLRSHGGDLTLVDPSATVRKLLVVTRLDKIFRVFDSELAASHASPVTEEASVPSDLGEVLKYPALQMW
jgi:anti-sigma B factor antagonist